MFCNVMKAFYNFTKHFTEIFINEFFNITEMFHAITGLLRKCSKTLRKYTTTSKNDP